MNPKNKETLSGVLSAQSSAFLDLLTSRGIVEDRKIINEKIRGATQETRRKMYHNTQLLLRHYRDIVWALECFPASIAEELDRPLNDLDALLSLVNAEIGLDNIKLENRLLSIQKSRLLLDRTNEALGILRQKPGNGEMLYSILRETYLIPDKLSHNEIIYRLNISTRHYYRLRQQAISILSVRLWSAPGAELGVWLEVLTLIEAK